MTVYDLIAPQVPSPDSLLNLSVTRTYSQAVCLSAGATLAGRSGASSAHKTVTSHTIKRPVHPQLSPASHDHSTSDHRRGLLVPKSTFFCVSGIIMFFSFKVQKPLVFDFHPAKEKGEQSYLETLKCTKATPSSRSGFEMHAFKDTQYAVTYFDGNTFA